MSPRPTYNQKLEAAGIKPHESPEEAVAAQRAREAQEKARAERFTGGWESVQQMQQAHALFAAIEEAKKTDLALAEMLKGKLKTMLETGESPVTDVSEAPIEGRIAA